jgi:hypothetical protein
LHITNKALPRLSNILHVAQRSVIEVKKSDVSVYAVKAKGEKEV